MSYLYAKTGELAPLTIKEGYAFFWGQWPSNWTPSPFTLDDQEYNCVEQWMMAEKARVFSDSRTRERILKEENPSKQKQYGRRVTNYNDDTWATVRVEIVLRGTLEKYRQNPALLALLLDTSDLHFVEASPYDKIWGIGMAEDDPQLLARHRWGQNLLGLILDVARETLRLEGG